MASAELNGNLSKLSINTEPQSNGESALSENQSTDGNVQITCFTEDLHDVTLHFQIIRLTKQVTIVWFCPRISLSLTEYLILFSTTVYISWAEQCLGSTRVKPICDLLIAFYLHRFLFGLGVTQQNSAIYTQLRLLDRYPIIDKCHITGTLTVQYIFFFILLIFSTSSTNLFRRTTLWVLLPY